MEFGDRGQKNKGQMIHGGLFGNIPHEAQAMVAYVICKDNNWEGDCSDKLDDRKCIDGLVDSSKVTFRQNAGTVCQLSSSTCEKIHRE